MVSGILGRFSGLRWNEKGFVILSGFSVFVYTDAATFEAHCWDGILLAIRANPMMWNQTVVVLESSCPIVRIIKCYTLFLVLESQTLSLVKCPNSLVASCTCPLISCCNTHTSGPSLNWRFVTSEGWRSPVLSNIRKRALECCICNITGCGILDRERSAMSRRCQNIELLTEVLSYNLPLACTILTDTSLVSRTQNVVLSVNISHVTHIILN